MSTMETGMQYATEKRKELIKRIAHEKALQALGKKGDGYGKLEGLKIGIDGTEILEPTFSDRLHLTGLGAVFNRLGIKSASTEVDLDASNEMKEVKEHAEAIINKRADIAEAQKLLNMEDQDGNSYLDLYPALRGLKAEDGSVAIREAIDAKKNKDEVDRILRENNVSPELLGLKRGSAELEDPSLVSNQVASYLRDKEKKNTDFNRGLQTDTLAVQQTNAKNNAISLKNSLEIEKARIRRDEIVRQNQLEYQKYQAEENRKMQKSRDDMTMRLAILDRSDRKEERETRREDRKEDERQAAIITLIQGLARLGQGFQL